MIQKDLKHIVSQRLCGKSKSKSHDECFKTKGKNNPLCRGHKKCRIAEKSDEQIEYVTSSTTDYKFLNACPGSGKTEVVGLKAAYEIANWQKPIGGIAVLTFTTKAAEVISQRISQFLGTDKAGFPHFVGTIDSWLHGYIANPFLYRSTGYAGKDGDYSIRIIESTSKQKFLNAFNAGFVLNQTGKPLANQYYYSWENEEYIFASGDQNIDAMRNSTTLTLWQKDKLWNAKQRLWESGFYTYEDIEFLCLQLLLDEDITIASLLSQRFPFIVIDECQDLSWTQLRIFEKLKEEGSIIHLVGDIDQGIYEFKNVDPEKVKEFVRDNKFSTEYLSSNYRSCQEIVDVCKKIVGSKKKINGQYEKTLKNPSICKIYQKDEIHKLTEWFENYLKENEIELEESAIITRSWKNVSKLRPSGNNDINSYQKRLAMSFYLWMSKTSLAMNDSLTYLGRFLAEKYFADNHCRANKYYCPDFVDSALLWRHFLNRILVTCEKSHPEIMDLNKTWSVWISAVKPLINDIVRDSLLILEDELSDKIPEFENLNGNTFRTPVGFGDNSVQDTLSVVNVNNSKIQITTIHSVKGQTFDAILVMSSPTKKGTKDGHWTNWLEDPTKEAARLAYVASSRPRKLLAWAVPELKKDEQKRIEDVGFLFV